MNRHRHQEWVKFLKLIGAETPKESDLHLIVDNCATHKHPKVKSRLKRHRRFQMHFTPTSRSWINLAERWFRGITDKRIRRGAFHSVRRLEQAIMDYIAEPNKDPKAIVLTANADVMLEKVRRARATLGNVSLNEAVQ